MHARLCSHDDVARHGNDPLERLLTDKEAQRSPGVLERIIGSGEPATFAVRIAAFGLVKIEEICCCHVVHSSRGRMIRR